MTPGKEYQCSDCGRAFLVYEEKNSGPKCPSCEGGNVARKEAHPLPQWLMQLKNKTGSS